MLHRLWRPFDVFSRQTLYRTAGWAQGPSPGNRTLLLALPVPSTLDPPRGEVTELTPLISAHLMKRIPKASRYTCEGCFGRGIFSFFFLLKSDFITVLVLAYLCWTVTYKMNNITCLMNVEEIKPELETTKVFFF